MAISSVLIALLVLVPASPGPFPGPLQEGKVVTRVDFTGSRRVSDAVLLTKVRTRPGVPFSRKELDEDIKRLTQLGKFLPISAQWKETPEGIEVTFTVRDREEVVWVRFSGRDGISKDDLTDLLQTKEDSLLSDYFVRIDQEAIKEKYLEEGYLFVSVDHEVKQLSQGVGVRFILEEGPRVKVDEILFEGNENLDGDDLEDRMQTKERALGGILEPGIFRETVLEEDLISLERFGRSQGFLDVEARLEALEFTPDREWLTLRIRIIEGPRYLVKDIRFAEIRIGPQGQEERTEGLPNSPEPEEAVRARLRLQPGEAILGNRLRGDTETVQRLYQGASYIRARVRPRVEAEESGTEVNVIYEVVSGERTRVGKVLVHGNDKTQSKVIRREMSFYPGESFDIAKLEDSYQRLLRTRYFKTIDMQLVPAEEEGLEHVSIEVEEARTGSLLIGGGIASTTGFFGNFQLIQSNFDIAAPPTSWRDIVEGRFFEGGGQTLQLIAQPGNQRSFYRAAFTEPRFLDLPLIFGLDLYWRDNRARRDYVEGRVGGSLTLGHALSPDASVRMRYRFEDIFITSVERDAPSDVIKVEGRNRLTSLTFSYHLDTRKLDRQLVVHDGGSFGAAYEWASKALGGEVNLNRLRGSADYHFNLYEIRNWGKIVLRFWAGAEWVGPGAGEAEVPIFERIFLGGPPNMRGFEYRGVGPHERGKPVGGEIMTYEGAEIGFPIVADVFRGVLFFDTGNVAENTSWLTINEHRISVGVGIRIKVPIFPAPIELDFGFPIRRENFDEKRTFSFFVGFPLNP